jgi:hypothetical protein
MKVLMSTIPMTGAFPDTWYNRKSNLVISTTGGLKDTKRDCQFNLSVDGDYLTLIKVKFYLT